MSPYYVRRNETDWYDENFHRCNACGTYNRIGRTPEKGRSKQWEDVSYDSKHCWAFLSLWLAGMPDGTTLQNTTAPYDTAPANSPVQLSGLTITPGNAVVFTVTGTIANGPVIRGGAYLSTPEGESGTIVDKIYNDENGISDYKGPLNSCIGVFLSDAQPDAISAPTKPDFSLAATRNYTSHSPELQAPFHIGTGRTSDGDYRKVIVPSGATRLFVGNHDGREWTGNQGQFQVNAVTASADFFDNEVDYIDTQTGKVFPTDWASSQGCWFCGSPLWRAGGKLGDMAR